MLDFSVLNFNTRKFLMFEETYKSGEIIIIAITAHYPFVIATCLEYANNCISEEKKVIIINLSWIMPHNLQRPISRHAINFSFKPAINTAVKKWCKSKNIAYFEVKNENRIDALNSIYIPEALKAVFERTIRSMFSKSFGTRNFNISDLPSDTIISHQKSFMKVLQYFERFFDKHNFVKVDKIVTVNGRFLLDSAVVQFCKLKGIKYSVLESVTSDWSNFEEFHTSAHVTSEIRNLLISQWERDLVLNPTKTRNLAIKHLEKRLSSDWEWSSSSIGKKHTKLTDKQFIAYFPSSDWEFGVHDDYFEQQIDQITQEDTFKWAAEYCKLHNLDLVVRVHPHPKNSRLAEIENNIWQNYVIKYGGILIKSNETFSSHEIAKEAFVNIVHQSSIGAELIYLGLPTVITSPTIYSFLVPELEATSQDALNFKLNNIPSINTKEKILPWAYYLENGGVAFKYFRIIDNYSVLYNGRYFLKKRKWFQVIMKFKNILKIQNLIRTIKL
jgi:hypothetical protein